MVAAAKERSFEEAAKTLQEIGGLQVSASTVGRIAHDVGQELMELTDCPPSRLSRKLWPNRPENAPQSVMVSVDGGRILTREAGKGPGVHNHRWRETKNATFERLEPRSFSEDPQPELPECFADPKHVAELVEMNLVELTEQELDELAQFQESMHSASSGSISRAKADSQEAMVVSSGQDGATFLTAEASSVVHEQCGSDEQINSNAPSVGEELWWCPRRLFRTCLSSLECASEFGVAMGREAQYRRFWEATCKAFVADGMAWNWRIWYRHFRDFTPILDFVHVVEYLYRTAQAAGGGDAMAWSRYLRWCQQTWQSQVDKVLSEISDWLQSRGVDPEATKLECSDKATEVLVKTYRYLKNNRERMDYVRYRKNGMPITSATMESLIKQIHLRVKGTEMYWNDARRGGESILRLRAAYLCDDNRLQHYLANRPGEPFVRRTTRVKLESASRGASNPKS